MSYPTYLIRKKEKKEFPRIKMIQKFRSESFKAKRKIIVEENEKPNWLCVNEEMRREGKHK